MHVLLPTLALLRRRDLLEVIGAALLAKAAGTGHRRIAAELGVPATTLPVLISRTLLGSALSETLLPTEDGARAVTLTPEQQAFINHDASQHARVLAGPGTGKSFASVAFLERLATTKPELRTRMLTFARAATAEFAQKMGDAELGGLGAGLRRSVSVSGR